MSAERPTPWKLADVHDADGFVVCAANGKSVCKAPRRIDAEGIVSAVNAMAALSMPGKIVVETDTERNVRELDPRAHIIRDRRALDAVRDQVTSMIEQGCDVREAAETLAKLVSAGGVLDQRQRDMAGDIPVDR